MIVLMIIAIIVIVILLMMITVSSINIGWHYLSNATCLILRGGEGTVD